MFHRSIHEVLGGNSVQLTITVKLLNFQIMHVLEVLPHYFGGILAI